MAQTLHDRHREIERVGTLRGWSVGLTFVAGTMAFRNKSSHVQTHVRDAFVNRTRSGGCGAEGGRSRVHIRHSGGCSVAAAA